MKPVYALFIYFNFLLLISFIVMRYLKFLSKIVGIYLLKNTFLIFIHFFMNDKVLLNVLFFNVYSVNDLPLTDYERYLQNQDRLKNGEIFFKDTLEQSTYFNNGYYIAAGVVIVILLSLVVYYYISSSSGGGTTPTNIDTISSKGNEIMDTATTLANKLTNVAPPLVAEVATKVVNTEALKSLAAFGITGHLANIILDSILRMKNYVNFYKCFDVYLIRNHYKDVSNLVTDDNAFKLLNSILATLKLTDG